MNSNDRQLEKAKELYEQGDKAQLLYWLAHCIRDHRPIPLWLEKAFLAACRAGTRFEIKSWDEVFGRPLKKGKRLATERRKWVITEPLWTRVVDLHAEGKPLDKELFNTVGKEFGVSGTVASEIYYGVMHEMAEDDS
jgi:hypothetical protein